ncbi:MULTISPECIES: AraC family transcriptional regulator [Roseateles]|uniref:AraC family transcriptional regulator n=1 Tax=Roseateles albus TaxID=2987525 RepID=A0ABT5KEP8_9BURK|nr:MULTISPECIES: AraC family transcriptional regulator [Roseateles]MCV2358093.1 AraC family transcriptional regulator [Paucibacter sp. TC2R-5]MDC8772388.1 AraC family transcriptional regulator [Roseateles albus]
MHNASPLASLLQRQDAAAATPRAPEPKPAGAAGLTNSWHKAMAQAFAGRGLCLQSLLDQQGLDPAEPDPRVLSDAYSGAWELAAARTGDAAIGLSVPAHPLVALGLLSHLVLAAHDLGEALQYILRFSALLSPAVCMELDQAAGQARLRVDILKGLRPTPLQRYDFIANVVLQSLNWATARRVRPLSISYPFAAPPDLGRWIEVFGCELEFNAEHFCIVFDSADLSTPIPTANASVAALCERSAAQAMMQRGGSIQVRVRQLLTQELPKGDPKREAIATLLHMSERTLQRRLLEESTSFNKLLDETRRELAARYLSRGSITATEMSFALGFADPSNFYRACKRWFGQSPSHLRSLA